MGKQPDQNLKTDTRQFDAPDWSLIMATAWIASRSQVFHFIGRPEDVHVVERLGGSRSFLLPRELTHSLTHSCETPSPWSSEAMAF
jgi:hypothetical protein